MDKNASEFGLPNFGSHVKTKEELFCYVLECDRKKYNLCKEHGIDIIYFSKDKKQKTINNKHISSIGRLLEIIKKYGRIE